MEKLDKRIYIAFCVLWFVIGLIAFATVTNPLFAVLTTLGLIAFGSLVGWFLSNIFLFFCYLIKPNDKVVISLYRKMNVGHVIFLLLGIINLLKRIVNNL